MNPTKTRTETRLQLNLAFVGCGAVFELYYAATLRGIQSSAGLGSVFLVDSNVDRAARFTKLFHKADAVASLNDAFAGCEIHLTIVASPPMLHCEHVVTALRNGSHVLCEKPLAVTSIDCSVMVEAAAKYQRLLATGFCRRYYPWANALKYAFEANRVRAPWTFEYFEGDPYGWPISSLSPFVNRLDGGGVLNDKGSHVLDLLSYVFGKLEVDGYEDDARPTGVETTLRLTLRGERVKGSVVLSWLHPLANRLRVSGGEMKFEAPTDSLGPLRASEKDGTFSLVKSPKLWPVSSRAKDSVLGSPRTYEDCFEFQLSNVLRAIRYGEPLMADGRAGLAAQQLISQAHSFHGRATE